MSHPFPAFSSATPPRHCLSPAPPILTLVCSTVNALLFAPAAAPAGSSAVHGRGWICIGGNHLHANQVVGGCLHLLDQGCLDGQHLGGFLSHNRDTVGPHCCLGNLLPVGLGAGQLLRLQALWQVRAVESLLRQQTLYGSDLIACLQHHTRALST
jgi:hypothetical protein